MDRGAGSAAIRQAIDLPALANEPPPLVGRAEELGRDHEVMARGRSALILCVGEPGLGKSAFLRTLSAGASLDEWAVARADDEGVLTVTPSTTPTEFGARLRRLLAMPPTAEAPVKTAASSGMGAALEGARRSLRDAPWVGLPELSQDLRERAPVLLMIDGYRPSERFEHALVDSFLPAFKASSMPVVVIIAEREEPLGRLVSTATDVIPFKPVDRATIRAYFDAFGDALDPPLDDGEAEAYARAASRDPELIGSLTRLLRLQRKGAS